MFPKWNANFARIAAELPNQSQQNVVSDLTRHPVVAVAVASIIGANTSTDIWDIIS